MRKQFRQQPRLAHSLNVGIKHDMKYETDNECTEPLHKNRRPVVMDPTLVRAAQLADLQVMKEAVEKGHDVDFVAKMYFGLEECFNTLLRRRVHSASG